MTTRDVTGNGVESCRGNVNDSALSLAKSRDNSTPG